MNQVIFETLDTATVRERLLKVADRILVVREVIDKWNEVEHCSVLPILKDAEQELGEVYGDLQLNGQGKQMISKGQEKKYLVEYRERLEKNLAQVEAEIEAIKEAPTKKTPLKILPPNNKEKKGR